MTGFGSNPIQAQTTSELTVKLYNIFEFWLYTIPTVIDYINYDQLGLYNLF